MRELVVTGLAWLLGLALLHRCERLPSGAECAALAVAAVLLLALHRRHWLLLAAAVMVTAVDPGSLMQPGFWLSFGAVGLLMAAGNEPAEGWRVRLMAALLTQLVAAVGLAPLSLICFGQLSAVGLLANLVAIPMISFVITPLALLGGLAAPLWSLAALLTQGLMAWLQLPVAWPGAVCGCLPRRGGSRRWRCRARC
ncbi:ComEC/Rec2 family competence protein [Roseateles sp. DC23W]|uniref:ComEC/Rec2 family competence protein n=1 Tax=Pelomonas dachongensis TaxID=3299029 RepID=A0ABW7EKL4_9BURK